MARLDPIARRRRDNNIVRAYRAGINRTAISEATRLTPRRVSQIVAEYNGVRQPWRPRLPIADRDRALYAKMRRYFGAAYARREMGLAP